MRLAMLPPMVENCPAKTMRGSLPPGPSWSHEPTSATKASAPGTPSPGSHWASHWALAVEESAAIAVKAVSDDRRDRLDRSLRVVMTMDSSRKATPPLLMSMVLRPAALAREPTDNEWPVVVSIRVWGASRFGKLPA